MLRSVPMVHMQIQVPSREAPAVTRHIAAQGLLHLIDIAHGRIAATDAAPPGTREELAAFRDLGHRIRRTAERLEVPLPDPTGALATTEIRDFTDEHRWLDEEMRPLESGVEELWKRLGDARERATHARESLRHGERLRRADVDVARLSRLRFTSVSLGLIRAEELASLAAVLSPAPVVILPLDVSEATVLAAVAVPAAVSDRLENALRVVSFERISLGGVTAETPEPTLTAVRDAEEAERRVLEELATLRTRSLPTLIELARRADLGALLLQAQTSRALRPARVGEWARRRRAPAVPARAAVRLPASTSCSP